MDSNAGALALSLSIKRGDLHSGAEAGPLGGRPEPDRGALRGVPDQDALIGALGYVHMPLGRLKK